MRSQELIKIFHEGISRCKVPQMVSTARAVLEDKDTSYMSIQVFSIVFCLFQRFAS